jgi:hypothetical protein
MKKKVKKLIDWFYDETDRGEDNISSCKNLYELVEKLQYRIEDLENEYMQMMCEMQKIYKLIGRENLNED